jgi:putative ABC transport system substrate-binding protein
VGIGLVDSLAHPGANLTGVTNLGNIIYGKQLELLHQLVPGAVRVAVLFDSAGPKSRLETTQTTAHALTLELMPLDVHSTQDIESALASAVAWDCQAVMSFGGPGVLVDAVPRLVDFELANRVPLTLSTVAQVEAGGLLSYGASFMDQGHAAARLVDKILRGVRPADLPIEAPTVFDFAINAKIAARLGITIPPGVAQQVTVWVQ